jgi:hypothetical protein
MSGGWIEPHALLMNYAIPSSLYEVLRITPAKSYGRLWPGRPRRFDAFQPR